MYNNNINNNKKLGAFALDSAYQNINTGTQKHILQTNQFQLILTLSCWVVLKLYHYL